MPEFFQINQLSCGYSEKFNLKNIQFEIKKGSLAAIIGPNGSGKTTLFRGITGEIKPKSGHIILDGKNLATLSFRQKAQHMAMVSQYLETPDISVEDFVLMGRMPYRSSLQFFETSNDYALAHQYMKYTDVFHLKDKMMNELSGGEQQLVDIARALTQEPKLLLLDEPTSHLDISHQVQILNLIQKLNSELNLTVLMIIHDLNLAGEYCDHLIMLNQGQIHIQGKPEDVLTYKNIEEVYKTVVVTRTNPISMKPAIFLISGEVLNRNK